MRPLLEAWSEVAERVRTAGLVALFADFDGTLAPFTARPEDARADRATRSALARLAGHPRVRVFVISGRRLADLRKRVAVPGIRYLGAQGWESGGERLPAATVERLRRAQSELRARLNGTAGVRLEDKGVCFALHHRGSDADARERAREWLEEVLAHFGGWLEAFAGDGVWEVLPREIRGKGHAVRRQWLLLGRGALAIYLGNDATDEPAFQALAGGITVRVGRRRGASRARYFLPGPAYVKQFLERLSQEVP